MTAVSPEKTAAVRQYLWSKKDVPTVKIAVLGSEGVGKRSILQRLCYGNVIEPTEATRELEWHKHITIQGRDVHVQFDLISDEPFHMPEEDLLEYIRNNEAYMLIYDVTNKRSFEVLDRIHRLYSRIPTRQRRWRTPLFVIASKADRYRGGWAVPFLEGDGFAKSIGATFLAMSSLTGSGTGDEVVVEMVSRVLLSRYQNEADMPVPKSRAVPNESDHRRKESHPEAFSIRTINLRKFWGAPKRLLARLRPKPKPSSLLAQRAYGARDRKGSFISVAATISHPSTSTVPTMYERGLSGAASAREYRRSRDLMSAYRDLPSLRHGSAGMAPQPKSSAPKSRSKGLERGVSPEFQEISRSQTAPSFRAEQRQGPS